jgi:hypothetical protein
MSSSFRWSVGTGNVSFWAAARFSPVQQNTPFMTFEFFGGQALGR